MQTVGSTPLSVSHDNGAITVVTGPLKFTVGEDPFHILDKVWLDKNGDGTFSDDEVLLDATPGSGSVFTDRFGQLERSAARGDVNLVVEKSGPIRVVLKAESASKFYTTSDMRSGFAVRIYAYADKPFIRIDYQLRNTALNSKFSWPLYFKSLDLDFPLKLGSNQQVRIGLADGTVYAKSASASVSLRQTFSDSFKVMASGSAVRSGEHPAGYINVTGSRGGVTAAIRYFWQMWPNGLAYDPASDTLQAQLFPAWSQQWVQGKVSITPHFTNSGLYWLQDLQAVYKQVLLAFGAGDATQADLAARVATFNHPPVVSMPTSWYSATQVTLDMGGLVPPALHAGPGDLRHMNKADYRHYNFFAYNEDKATQYNFGWDQFFANVPRKYGAAAPGGWPHGAARDFILYGNPRAYYYASVFAMGELNMRPQWLPGYEYEEDFDRLHIMPTVQFGFPSWRDCSAWKCWIRIQGQPLAGTTAFTAAARDDQHGWFYHIEQAYNLNANLWIKGWLSYMGELRMARLYQRGGVDMHDRAVGHALSNALQAFRATGDMNIIHRFPWYIQLLRGRQSRLYGAPSNGSAKVGQLGFLARSIISYMTEVRGYNRLSWAQAFQLLSGYIEWNRVYGNFGYLVEAAKGQHGKSMTEGQNMVGPQAWYYLHTGRETYRQQILAYVDTGINGGRAASPRVSDWSKDGKGGFVGRYGQYVYRNMKTDRTPAEKITDLTASRIGGGNVEVSFTVPAGHAERYHFVYAKKPISAAYTKDPGKMNWWAAHVRAPQIAAAAGQKATFVFHTNIVDPFYLAMFTFDNRDNLSKMSNVYHITTDIRDADGLPPPWHFDNVGSPQPAGSVHYAVKSNVYDVGVFSIVGKGSFHDPKSGAFAYVHRAVSGDHTIVARVDPNSYFTVAGPMFRESLTSGSRFVALYNKGSGGWKLVYRASDDAKKTVVPLGGAEGPAYLKLVRRGDKFTAYSSTDGTSWGVALESVTVAGLPTRLDAGVAAASSSYNGKDFPAKAAVSRLSISGVDAPPVAVDDAANTRAGKAVTIDVLANDSDPDGALDASSVTLQSAPSHGTALANADGTVTYTPEDRFGGSDSFTYAVKDDDGVFSNPATVNVTVSGPANEPPVAVDDAANTRAGKAVTIDVLANDSDPDGALDASSVTLQSAPAHGTIVVNSDGSVTFAPADGFTGSDGFTYTVRDNEGVRSNPASVTIEVQAQAKEPSGGSSAGGSGSTGLLIVTMAGVLWAIRRRWRPKRG